MWARRVMTMLCNGCAVGEEAGKVGCHLLLTFVCEASAYFWADLNHPCSAPEASICSIFSALP